MDENVIKRIQPHSAEAEQKVVASMLMDRGKIVEVSEIISAGDFYNRSYGAIFQSALDLYNEGKNVDLITMKEQLKQYDVPEEIGSIEYMRELVNGVISSADAVQSAKIVYEKSMLRKLIRTMEEIAAQCYEGKDSLEDIMDETEKKIMALMQTRSTDEYIPMSQVVYNVLKKIEEASRTKSMVTGLATGFKRLDQQTAGLQPADMILIAARPSMGKTAFSLNLLQYVTVDLKKPAVIFSLEMSKDELAQRMMSVESQVDSKKLRIGRMDEREWDRLLEGSATLAHTNLIIDDTPGISIGELRSKCRRYKMAQDIQLVVIDYLQLMTGGGSKKTDSRQQEVAEISRSLKALARELNVPVIALSQLSRNCETRPDHRPMLSDLRESGSIEQDADVVMFLYRDEYYNKESPDAGTAEVIIAKQRKGPTGTIKLAWVPELTRFMNLADERDEQIIAGNT